MHETYENDDAQDSSLWSSSGLYGLVVAAHETGFDLRLDYCTSCHESFLKLSANDTYCPMLTDAPCPELPMFADGPCTDTHVYGYYTPELLDMTKVLRANAEIPTTSQLLHAPTNLSALNEVTRFAAHFLHKVEVVECPHGEHYITIDESFDCLRHRNSIFISELRTALCGTAHIQHWMTMNHFLASLPTPKGRPPANQEPVGNDADWVEKLFEGL